MSAAPLIHQILEQLEREGVTHIFGVPGGPLTAFFGALRARNKIQYVLARHEEGAAFMANAFARVGRGIGVCCVTSGPGATNALTGVAGALALFAHQASGPLLDLWEKRLGVGELVRTLEETGNATVATVATMLSRFAPTIQQKYIVLLGLGVGQNFAAALLRRVDA
jgi:glyoxylate carboligase